MGGLTAIGQINRDRNTLASQSSINSMGRSHSLKKKNGITSLRKAPQNVVDRVFNNTVKLNRLLKNKFESRNKLENALTEEGYTSSDKGDGKAGISSEEFREFVLRKCNQDIVEDKVSK